MAFKTKTNKTISLKSGSTIVTGSDVQVLPLSNTHCGVIFVPLNGGEKKTFKIAYTVAYQYLAGFMKPPSINALQKTFEEDSNCKNPIGNTVEIDGEDHYGFPSWCRILLGV